MVKESKGAGNEGKSAHRREEGASSCREFLRQLPEKFNAESDKKFKAVYQFEISGEENFTVQIRVDNGKCSYHEGSPHKPDITIKAPADIFLKIVRGELNGQQAFLDRKFSVEGNFFLLLKMKNLLSS